MMPSIGEALLEDSSLTKIIKVLTLEKLLHQGRCFTENSLRSSRAQLYSSKRTSLPCRGYDSLETKIPSLGSRFTPGLPCEEWPLHAQSISMLPSRSFAIKSLRFHRGLYISSNKSAFTSRSALSPESTNYRSVPSSLKEAENLLCRGAATRSPTTSLAGLRGRPSRTRRRGQIRRFQERQEIHRVHTGIRVQIQRLRSALAVSVHDLRGVEVKLSAEVGKLGLAGAAWGGLGFSARAG